MRQFVSGLWVMAGAVVVAGVVVTAQAPPPAPPAPGTQAPTAPPAGAPGPGSPTAGGPARGGAPAAPPPSPASIERAGQVLTATRQALGGPKLAAVRTLVANGRARRVRGNNLVPIEFEISLELPDKFVRRDESPAEETDPTSAGFNGDDLIQIPPPAAPVMPARPGGPAPAAPTPEQLAAQRRTRVNTVKQDFARFALGIFADSFATFPLTFAHAGIAEAPQGKADVLDVRGPANFTMRLFVNSQTRLPIMVSWTQPPTNVVVITPGQTPPTVAPGAVVITAPAAPAASAPQADKDAYAKEVQALRAKAQATPVEHRLYYADYRDVDGVQLPFRLRRAIGADTTEETSFDRYRINTNIAPQRFTPVK